ncbi:MAG: NapC/NirT family cytochrome c [Acidobacteriota bacterium]|nr:NapC/NirT family cytochrome c [Acidobacteriota bacterium]
MTEREEKKPAKKISRRRLFKLLYNPMSLLGLALCGFSLGMMIIFSSIDYIVGGSTPYLGLITFLILPPFLFVGMLLLPAGAIRFHRRLNKLGFEPRSHFTLDLNKAHHRKNFVLFLFVTFVSICMIGTMSYHGYHYTESTRFCGSCHSVMEPQFSTHQNSPHARVKCAACHVGSGASWYVKSKLSGLYQVYSVLRNKYPRPIPTPIQNLRPARDTCERCHWPKFFIENKMMTKNYFLTDEENTAGAITLMMIIGGQPDYGIPSGIHWHIVNKVVYIATDEANDQIPWVQVDYGAGQVEVFQSLDNPLTEEQVATLPRHTMDCMDCHNRPAHIFGSPAELMNKLLFTRKVDPNLPNIRRIGAQALAREYRSMAEAEKGIGRYILKAYEDQELTTDKKRDVLNAIESITDVYKKNFFPTMKTRWDVHSSNIGHKTSPGCFRCHDGNHKSEEGKVIEKDCNLCHIIVAQGEQRAQVLYDPHGLEFVHPDGDDEFWRDDYCSDCHTGEE